MIVRPAANVAGRKAILKNHGRFLWLPTVGQRTLVPDSADE
jgi:hypothetical protein